MVWNRLIRFTDNSGNTLYGEPCIESPTQLDELLRERRLEAIKLVGRNPFELVRTSEKVRVVRLLGILKPDDVPVIKCIGLNYVKHINELGRRPPPYPSLFMKPPPAIAAFDDEIRVPKTAQEMDLDYEGELAVIIGKTGKNIAPEEALAYVAGYAASNDVSSRKWQRDPDYAGHVPQWSYGKSFDGFAPIGPMLVSPQIVGAADSLRLTTMVNGEVRQDTNTSDLLFNVASLVSFLSQGSTLQRGTVIMTGTPGGVAMGMRPPKWLRNGDVVEVAIEQLGSCINRVQYEADARL